MDPKIQFGNKIREIRKNLWLSQEDLAKKSWLHRTYIWIIERGKKNICLENIYILANALWVNVNILFI